MMESRHRKEEAKAMEREQIVELIGKCLEKAGKDFLAGIPFDTQALQAMLDAGRVLSHIEKDRVKANA